MPQLFLINGEEIFLKERAARDEAVSSLADSVSEFILPDGLADYEAESSSFPFFGRRRAFIVWDASSVPILPVGEEDFLVVVSTPKAKLKDERAKRVLEFPRLKAYDDKNEYLTWILKEGRGLNIDLSKVASALFMNSGKSLRKISSEIRKLAVLVPSGEVSPEEARSVLCFSADITPKEVVDSICEGNPAKALAFLDKLQERGDETGWVLAYLQRHVIQQLLMERALELKVPHSEAAKLLDVHPFVYKKMLDSRPGLWAQSSLATSLNTLCDLDLSHKRGDASAKLGLEVETIRLSEEARNNVKRIRGR